MSKKRLETRFTQVLTCEKFGNNFLYTNQRQDTTKQCRIPKQRLMLLKVKEGSRRSAAIVQT